jgi:hypothetical protein
MLSTLICNMVRLKRHGQQKESAREPSFNQTCDWTLLHASCAGMEQWQTVSIAATYTCRSGSER